MFVKKLMICVGLIFFLIGCSSNPDPESANNDQQIKYTKMSADDDFMDQQAANQAKDFLGKYEDITAIKAVNTSKKLVVAIEVHHNKRFQLENLGKKYAKKLKKKFPKFKTELSTDQKIFIELNRLEQKIDSNNISNKNLEKKVKHIIKLTKEKT